MTRARYEKLTIYFMSGTGNSFRSAFWMAKEAKKSGADVRLIPLEAGNPREEIEPSPRQLVGLVMPTHGFTAPWHVMRFALRMPPAGSARAFVVPTRAGCKFGPVFTPGIAGTAAFIIAIILAFKGYNIRGVMSLDMPSNWMSLHAGFKPESVEAINERAQPLAEQFMQSILSGRLNWFTLNNLYELLLGILLFPISFLYLIIGRFILAKIFFANARCNGCGQCADHCPVGAISLRGGGNPRPFWRYNCESCMRCMAFCPEEAIECSQPWAVLLSILSFVPFSFYLIRWLEGFVPFPVAFNNYLVRFTIDLLYIYATVFLSYRLLYLLSRLPLFRTILTYSTFTHIYRRHREPGTKVSDLVAGRDDENPRGLP